MNSIAFVALFACFAAANAGVIVAPGSTKILQGPSTSTRVLGSDGSSISSDEIGGSIVHEDKTAVIAEEAPVLAAEPAALAYSVPRFALPHTAYYRTLSPYSAPLLYSRPAISAFSTGLVAEKQLDTLVDGPSGTIATSKTVHRPALIAAPEIHAARLHSYYL